MRVYHRRSQLAYLVDATTFPLRALFVHEEWKFGLYSLRDGPMRTVAQHCTSRGLDVGCGPNKAFIRQFYSHPGSVDIDCFPYDGVDNLVEDLENIPFPDASFDTVTLIAVGGHTPRSKRAAEFGEFARGLAPRTAAPASAVLSSSSAQTISMLSAAHSPSTCGVWEL